MSPTSVVVPVYVRERVLTVAGEQGFGSDVTITYEPGSSTGDGYIGQIVRAWLTDSQCSMPIICKFPPVDREQREQFNAMLVFEREHFIYQRVLPAFADLQHQHGLSHADDQYFGNYAKCYHTYCDTEREEALLVLEDLTAPDRAALKKLDAYEPIDYDHVYVLMVALGKLNACSFALKQHRPELFRELQQLNDLLSVILDTEQLRHLTPRHCQLAASAFDEADDPVHRQQLLDLAVDMWHRTGEHIRGDRAEPYAALNHGDCWTNNVMFGYGDSGRAAKICLFDWQLARYSSPVLDFVLFIYLCGQRDLRQAEKFASLVQAFYDSFAATLRRLGGDPESTLPQKELHKQTKRFGRLALSMGTYALPNFAKLPDEVRVNPEHHRDDLRLQKYYKLMRELVEDTDLFDRFE
ncbi:uncharacterized protein LOC128275166 [Anopheles cruzii]|uniref:uncharacterized protein LOC128275166 n=1 Tax=Anopheles cruzii TaxID=68878 RepID=UPI0022EC7E80|nr:uncharacterized protein LOC128275166 [Anopheles cruzii]